jgi:hypothetical protein
MHVVNPQHLKNHFMETKNGRFKVEGFVDIAVYFIKVDELIFAQTFINPSITHRLELSFASRIFLELFYQLAAIAAVFEDIKTVTLANVSATRANLTSVLVNFAGKVMKLYLLFLGALHIESIALEDRAFIFFLNLDFSGVNFKTILLLRDNRYAFSIVEKSRNAGTCSISSSQRVQAHAIEHTVSFFFKTSR